MAHPKQYPQLKKQLLSASALKLKLCVHQHDQSISHLALHTMLKRATPEQLVFLNTHFTYTKFTMMNPKALNGSIFSLTKRSIPETKM